MGMDVVYKNIQNEYSIGIRIVLSKRLVKYERIISLQQSIKKGR